MESATLDLAAVVEPIRQVAGGSHTSDDEPETFTGEAAERYRFGVRTMEEQGIRVLTTNDLARAAATARAELRV